MADQIQAQHAPADESDKIDEAVNSENHRPIEGPPAETTAVTDRNKTDPEPTPYDTMAAGEATEELTVNDNRSSLESQSDIDDVEEPVGAVAVPTNDALGNLLSKETKQAADEGSELGAEAQSHEEPAVTNAASTTEGTDERVAAPSILDTLKRRFSDLDSAESLPMEEDDSRLNVTPGHGNARFCVICYNNEDEMLAEGSVVLTCHHTICHGCIIIAFERAYKPGNERPASCCNREIRLSVFEEVLPEKLLATYTERKRLCAVPMAERFYCSNVADCGVQIHPVMTTDGEVICLTCGSSTCPRCGIPSHNNPRACKPPAPGPDITSLDVLAKDEGWRRCDGCKTWIERVDGCPHIICFCGHEFCYHCGTEWDGVDLCVCQDALVAEGLERHQDFDYLDALPDGA